MIPWSVIWAFIPSKYLITFGAAIAALLLIWAGFAHHQSRLKHTYFQKGYAFAHDSAEEATILRLKAQHQTDSARAAESYRVAQQASAPLDTARQHFDSVTRHTPRLEALTVPIAVDTSLVGVYVENTGEHFVLPRTAARYWAISDSLVNVARILLDKYAAANRQWATAWADEHSARIGSDSLADAYAERLRSVTVPEPPRNMHRIAYLAFGVVAGAVLHNQFRHR